jgi:hypothetical protein
MKMTGIILAGCAAFIVLGSAASAQTPMTGTVTRIDRLDGTIAIQLQRTQAQSGTVGANTGGLSEQFKLQGGSLETLHAGDNITYTATEAGGVKTITKIDKQ